MKYLSLVLVLFSTACATTYERCSQVTEMPYGLSLGMSDEEVFARFPGESKDEIAKKVLAGTKFEWNRYGSMDACVAYKEREKQAIVAIAQSGSSYQSTSTPYVHREPETGMNRLAKDNLCRDACRLMEDQFACFQACR